MSEETDSVLELVLPTVINAATLINQNFLYFTSDVVYGFVKVLHEEGQLRKLPTKDVVVNTMNKTRSDMFHGNVHGEPRLWCGNLVSDIDSFVPASFDLGARFRHYVLATFPWQTETRALKHVRKYDGNTEE